MDEATINLLLLLGLLAVFFLFVVRPQRRRLRAVQQVQAELAVGDRVLTTAGLYATIAELTETDVVLEVAPGVRSRFTRAAVVRVVPA